MILAETQRQTTISAVMVAFNSAKYLFDCLNSVKWAHEILIIDLGSTDSTIEIGTAFGCRIMNHEWVPIAEKVLNEGIEKCIGNWILVISPDERIPEKLASTLLEIADEGQVEAVSIPFQNLIFGRWIQHSGWNSDAHVRFFRKGSVSFNSHVHSAEQVNGRVLELTPEPENQVVHLAYDNVSQFIDKLNRYTTLEVEKRSLSKPVEISELVELTFRELRGRFFSAQGYRDGIQGLAACELMSFYRLTTGLKHVEKTGWSTYPDDHIISQVRQGLLQGIWQLLSGMEQTSSSVLQRLIYRGIRSGVALALRLHVF